MAKYLIQDTSLIAIADEVRTLADTTDTMSPNAMTTNLQSANNEVSTQETLLKEISSLLDTKVLTVTENCNFGLTLTNFGSNMIVAVYSFINEAGQIETTEQEYHAGGTFNLSVLKGVQILLMGISGSTPGSHIDSGSIVATRSFNDGAYYYAYSFVCNGDCSVNFTY